MISIFELSRRTFGRLHQTFVNYEVKRQFSTKQPGIAIVKNWIEMTVLQADGCKRIWCTHRCKKAKGRDPPWLLQTVGSHRALSAFSKSPPESSHISNSTASSEYNLNPSDDVAGQQPRPYALTLPIVLGVGFALFILTVTNPALTVSVCRAYLNKDVCIKSSLRAIPQSFFRILLTFVCLTAALVGVFLIIEVVAGLIGALIIILLRVRDPSPLIIILAVALGVVGMLYFGFLWSLAHTVTILEQKWGWQALSRSAYLMKGRKLVGLRLIVFFSLCSSLVRISISDEAPMLARFSVAAVSIVTWSLLSLVNEASNVIFYCSCMEFHNESPEMLPTTTKSTLEHTLEMLPTTTKSAAYTKLNSPANESSFIVGDV